MPYLSTEVYGLFIMWIIFDKFKFKFKFKHKNKNQSQSPICHPDAGGNSREVSIGNTVLDFENYLNFSNSELQLGVFNHLIRFLIRRNDSGKKNRRILFEYDGSI